MKTIELNDWKVPGSSLRVALVFHQRGTEGTETVVLAELC